MASYSKYINQTLTVFTLKNTDVLGPQVQSGITIKKDMSLNLLN